MSGVPRPPKRVSEGLGSKHASEKQMDLARGFLSALFMSLRTARIHDPQNKAFDNAVRSLRDAADALFASSGGFRIQFVEDSVFLDGNRVKFEGGAFDTMRKLRETLESKGLGGIEVAAPPTDDLIRRLILMFGQNTETAAESEELLRSRIGLLGVQKFADASQGLKVDRRVFAVQSYAKLILALREQYARLAGSTDRTAGGMMAPPRLRAIRVVQDLVELSDDRLDFLLRLATNKIGAPLDELLGANSAVLSIAIGRALGLSRQHLVSVGTAALFHDIGRPIEAAHGTSRNVSDTPSLHPEDPSLSEDRFVPSDPSHTRASFARLLAAGPLGRSDITRAVIIAEHATQPGDKYAWGTERPVPHLLARIVAGAVMYSSLTMGIGTKDGKQLHELDALSVMMNDRSGRIDPRIADILVNLLRAFPIGSELRLDSGQRAIVHSYNADGRWDRPIVSVEDSPPVQLDLAAREGGRFVNRIDATLLFRGLAPIPEELRQDMLPPREARHEPVATRPRSPTLAEITRDLLSFDAKEIREEDLLDADESEVSGVSEIELDTLELQLADPTKAGKDLEEAIKEELIRIDSEEAVAGVPPELISDQPVPAESIDLELRPIEDDEPEPEVGDLEELEDVSDFVEELEDVSDFVEEVSASVSIDLKVDVDEPEEAEAQAQSIDISTKDLLGVESNESSPEPAAVVEVAKPAAAAPPAEPEAVPQAPAPKASKPKPSKPKSSKPRTPKSLIADLDMAPPPAVEISIDDEISPPQPKPAEAKRAPAPAKLPLAFEDADLFEAHLTGKRAAAKPAQATEPKPSAPAAPAEPAASALSEGSRVLGATLTKHLIRQDACDVFDATSDQGGGRVTVRVFVGGEYEGVSSERWQQLFARHERVLSKIDHPAFPRLIASGKEKGMPTLVIERKQGRALSALAAQGELPKKEALRALIAELSTALHYLHEHMIVLSSLRADAVGLGADGRTFIPDMSLALFLGEDPHPRLKERGATLSPEFLAGDGYGPMSDQYALGAVIYQLLTGKPPSAEHPSKVVPGVDPVLADAAMRALAKNPAERFQSCGALAEAIVAG